VGFCGAAFERALREGGARGGAPEMPDAAGVLADAEDYGVAVFCVGEGDGLVNVGSEPRIAAVEASAEGGVVVIEDEVFSVCAAGKLGVGDFDLGVLVSGDTGVGDGDSPERRRGEVRWLGDGVDVCGFIADFRGDAGFGLGERDQGDDER